MENLLILLGKRIHDLRAAKKWSQEEFAHVSGFHRTYIGQIERGEKNISFGNLSKIAAVLGVTMSELLSGLEDGSKSVVRSSRLPESAWPGMKIQKLVKQLRVQQTALDRAMTSLEELVLTASPTKPAATRPSKRGSVKR